MHGWKDKKISLSSLTLYTKYLCLFVLILGSFVMVTDGVDKSKFKTSAQSPFCARHRDSLEPIAWIDANSVISDNNKFIAEVHQNNAVLDIVIYFTKAGAIRIQVDEKIPRWKPPFVLVEKGVTIDDSIQMKMYKSKENNGAILKFILDPGAHPMKQALSGYIQYNPLKITFSFGSEEFLIINHFGNFYYETKDWTNPDSNKNKDTAETNEVSQEYEGTIVDWGEDGNPIYAEEEVEENVKEDSKAGELIETNGDKAVGVDILLIGSSAVYGLPEHTTSFSLVDTKTEKYPEPYRLYTLDVYDYALDSTMALYGAIPIIFSHSLKAKSSSNSQGIFWNNPTDTFVDITTVQYSGKRSRKVKWMSEAGNFDLFIFPGDNPALVMKQIQETTGSATLPPIFSLGYHQCRWNYNNEKDLLGVNKGFEDHDIPVDVLWLDIEHTDGRRYFTFDSKKFPNPLEMYKQIDFYGRRVVNIVDPHIKRDKNYHVHVEAEKLGLYIKDSSGGKDFDGWCWPGSSSYIDFTMEKARRFWASQFTVERYKGTINGVVHIWNDMNEPSVFNQPEITIPKDAKNFQGIEFREFHNVYGFYFHASTQAGLLYRDLVASNHVSQSGIEWRTLKCLEDSVTEPSISIKRGFVLSRAFYAGSQRFGAIWTGDNAAKWDHLKASIPMILSISIVGFPFVGADVGGFFGNPSVELLTRWYQAAAFQPFFRAHAHLESQRREPWLFGAETTKRLRDIISERYRYLPYIYSIFKVAEDTGKPVMRPLFFDYPNNEKLLRIENQWMFGDALLLAPILDEAVTSHKIIFPPGIWYDTTDFSRISSNNNDVMQKDIPVTIDTLPKYLKGGSIIPQKWRRRRSSHQMLDDPITLLVALNEQFEAEGHIYCDDEETFDYIDKKAFCIVNFKFRNNVLEIFSKCPVQKLFVPNNKIERIVLLGAPSSYSSLTFAILRNELDKIENNLKITSVVKDSSTVLVVKNPDISLINDFKLIFKNTE